VQERGQSQRPGADANHRASDWTNGAATTTREGENEHPPSSEFVQRSGRNACANTLPGACKRRSAEFRICPALTTEWMCKHGFRGATDQPPSSPSVRRCRPNGCAPLPSGPLANEHSPGSEFVRPPGPQHLLTAASKLATNIRRVPTTLQTNSGGLICHAQNSCPSTFAAGKDGNAFGKNRVRGDGAEMFRTELGGSSKKRGLCM
jgi:hypothetical protein